jgi:hypothetical protein
MSIESRNAHHVPQRKVAPTGLYNDEQNGNFDQERGRQEQQVFDAVSETQPLVCRPSLAVRLLTASTLFDRVDAQMNRFASSDMVVGCLESVAVGFCVVLRSDREVRLAAVVSFLPKSI